MKTLILLLSLLLVSQSAFAWDCSATGRMKVNQEQQFTIYRAVSFITVAAQILHLSISLKVHKNQADYDVSGDCEDINRLNVLMNAYASSVDGL